MNNISTTEKAKEIIDEVIRIANSGEIVDNKKIRDLHNDAQDYCSRGIEGWATENEKERIRREQED